MSTHTVSTIVLKLYPISTGKYSMCMYTTNPNTCDYLC